MKIIYAIGNDTSSYLNFCLIKKNILENFPHWSIRSYGKIKNKYYRFELNEKIDWCQESLHIDTESRSTCKKTLGDYYFIYNIKNFNILINEIVKFEPDIIISDMNYDISCIARMLGIKCWYISCIIDLFNADGTLFNAAKTYLKKFPIGDNYINYHLFGEIKPYILSVDDNEKFSTCFINNSENNINKILSTDSNLSRNCFINSSSLLISSLIGNESKIIIDQHLSNFEDQVNFFLLKDKLEFINNFENYNENKQNEINKFIKSDYKFIYKNNKQYLHEQLKKYEQSSI